MGCLIDLTHGDAGQLRRLATGFKLGDGLEAFVAEPAVLYGNRAISRLDIDALPPQLEPTAVMHSHAEGTRLEHKLEGEFLSSVGFRQYGHAKARAPFLHLDGSYEYIQRTFGEEPGCGGAGEFRTEVIEIGFQLRHMVALSVLGSVPENSAQDIRTVRSVSRARSVADALDRELRHGSECRRKLRKQAGSGGSDEFHWLVDLAQRDTGQNLERGGSGQGKAAMRAANEACALLKSRCADFRCAERFQRDTKGHDIDDRVHGSDLVKMNLIREHSVDLAFRMSDPSEDRHRTSFYEGRKLARLDECANSRKCPSVDMIRSFVMMMVVGVLLPVMMVHIIVAMSCFVRLSMGMRMAMLAMGEMDVEFNTLDAAANLSRKVEVKLAAKAELRQLSLNDLRRHAKVTKGANRHVAANTGKTIEKEGAH